MRLLPLIIVSLLACDSPKAVPKASSQDAPSGSPATASPATVPAHLANNTGNSEARGDSAASGSNTPAAAAPGEKVAAPNLSDPKVAESYRLQKGHVPIRALYVNRFAAQGSKSMRHLLGIGDSTEINALVIDIKDEFGLNYSSSDPLVQKNAGTQTKIANLKALVDSIRAHGMLPIARIVVFKDSVAARMNPDQVIRKPDGTPWRDKQGLTWVNPYSKTIWEYNFRVAEEVVKLGFGEVQFDYIRFPEPYKSLPQQVFPGANGRPKPEVLAEFLRAAKARFDKLGVRTTADVFGLVTTVRGPLEIGQEWEKVSPSVDVMLPMVYPSHYPRGSFGIKVPNADPYKTVWTAIAAARKRDDKLGITTPEHVRPWLQAFTLGAPRYGAAEITAQKRAVYDAGYDGWVLWHPGSKYDLFLPALAKTFVSQKKNPPVTVPTGVRTE